MAQTKAQLLNLTTFPQKLKAYAETYNNISINSGVLSIDLSLGTIFNVNLNADITSISVSNVDSTSANSFTLFLTADGTQRTVTWTINGTSVKWPGGSTPTVTSTNGKVDVISIITNNGGTTWFGFLGGQSY